MVQYQKLDGVMFAKMICEGAVNLKRNATRINDLNVFPIPDGDTGSNMLMTVMGGVHALNNGIDDISKASRIAADGMLLSARGNSGVILSQLFDGLAKGLANVKEADGEAFSQAMKCGVKQAYSAVMEPCEGTILTVARCASEHKGSISTIEEYLNAYIDEAKCTLKKTPEMLDVLKKAGVVDSGGAGLICIVEGMRDAFLGRESAYENEASENRETAQTLDLDRFGTDSVLEYGYCTELLLRLQNAKTDVENFSVDTVTDFLKGIGESVVAFKTGSIIKIHVHTMTPDKVLCFCRQYGEFLTVKIENMSLQHNNTVPDGNETNAEAEAEKKRYGVVAVCSGEGIKQMFTDRGADRVVDGGQSMNPSAEDLLNAYRSVNAENIFVLPNNGNVIMAAQQAAELCHEKNVVVIESKTVGDGYAALAMMDPDENDPEILAESLREAMSGVVTAEVSHCIRDANIDGVELHTGDHIGVLGKKCIAVGKTRTETACRTADELEAGNYDVCIAIRGKDTAADEMSEFENYMNEKYSSTEVYTVNGMQDVYDFILILQ